MSRLADYFIIVGYDDEKERGGVSQGKILQRVPETDWEDCPFTQGVELFCQPAGWSLSSQRQRPTFHVAVLTDIDAERHYLAALTFHERVSMLPTKVDDEDGDESDGALVHHSLMFAPKTLVLISRLDYFEAFRNCLGIMYTVHVENLQVQMETLIGNILGCVQVPCAGGPQVRFSIGAGDRQALQPPLSPTLPVSHQSVSLLFDLLGINNTLTVVCAALTDHKILFHSESYSRLTDTCHATTTLLYPFKYRYVYIPILPAALLEVLSTPTPFIAGIHTCLLPDLADLMTFDVVCPQLDVIIVDLDGGSLRVPECVSLARLPEPILSRTKHSLRLLLDPELLSADCAFPPSPGKPPPPPQRDKDIRAVFLRMFAELLTGYRCCLTTIRIHPEPFITFYKANFLGHHGMVEDDFLVRLLDSMSFSHFVNERGPPFRVTDIFDELYASLWEQLKEERGGNQEKVMDHIRELSHQLYVNENPNPQPYVQKVPKPTEGAHARIHQPPFPLLDAALVQSLIEEGLAKHSIKNKLVGVRPQLARVVPLGPGLSSITDRYRHVENNARRLEVLRNCVAFIFENKISDARIIFPAVLRALKSREARLALTQELSFHVQSNRAMLENQQFDLVVKLLNCALQHDSHMDENGVAAAILPLATAFCRKLCTGVIQFAYTVIQEHAVWGNLQFWEQAFYQDVQRQIRHLYLPQYEEHSESSATTSPESQRSASGASPPLRPREMGALEIAAEQMRQWPNMTPEEQVEHVNNEESTVYSQAIHYANRMVYLRVPLDCSKMLRSNAVLDGESNSNSNITASIAESDSYDAESGFDESEATDIGATVIKFVTRFVDKVCNEGKVTQEHIKSLHQMIPGVVAMHIETLEAVNKESKRLPPVQKPKILEPALLAGEEIVMEGLRVYLLPDGREEGTGGNMGGPSLLPAEGAIFLTTYRIVFKGTPCDPLACEMMVIRGFPVSTLTKEKKMSVQDLPQVEQTLSEGLQLRSSVFQLMKIAFDEEVGSENIDTFRKLAHKVRNPPCVQSTFAFTGHLAQTVTPLHKQKEKNASLRQFAKRTLLKTARKAGLKSSKSSARKTKYVLPAAPGARRNASPRSSDSESDRPSSEVYDDLSIIEERDYLISRSSDPRNISRLMEYPGYQDYERLGFGSLSAAGQKSRSEPFRITLVNASYSVCRSYPALLVVPQNVTDESIRKFARCHRQSRFPIITWRHPRTKALLLRASGFHSRGLMGMLRHNPATGTSSGETSSSLEQEKYFSAVVAATPTRAVGQAGYHDSFTSLDSLLMSSTGDPLHIPDTPDTQRRTQPASSMKGTPAATRSSFPASNPNARPKPTSALAFPQAAAAAGSLALHTVQRLRASMGKGKGRSAASLSRMGSLREKGARPEGTRGTRQNGGLDPRGDLINTSVAGLSRVALYVLGEKAQMKGIKVESFPRCDFIPVDFFEVRYVKASFKKLMRACVPSATPSAEASLFRAVQDAEWLQQIQSILQLAGAAVDLLDSQGSSVLVCLEDGWDVTTQVTSVAQVCLDPHYRTLDGFRALVEKEWLQFGHRFSHRSNQTSANQGSGFAPIFLQFLDAVHQIHNQFPMQFEFNQFYLRFLAYHVGSNRFRTFMLDSEWERVEAGWLEERRTRGLDAGDGELGGTLPRGANTAGSGSLGQGGAGASVWEYIEKQHRRSPLFFNYLYCPNLQEQVLRPYSGLARLKTWDFYLTEDLAHGPSYDLELVARERQQSEDSESGEGSQAGRRVINACYHNVPLCQPDFFTAQFQEIRRLETELGHLPQTWRAVWDRLEPGPRSEHSPRPPSYPMEVLRSHGRSAHKRSTLEILVRGKMLGEAARALNQPHRFERYNFTTPAYCDYCSQVLWGLSKTGMHCADCGYNCHEKCASQVPKNCSRLKPVSDPGAPASAAARTAASETIAAPSVASSAPPFEHFPATMVEHRTHEGYLYKQGHVLKGWKQRWFVLDTMKHQMRYYDAMEDSTCKGSIDLAEVMSVQGIKHAPGAPKKAEDNSFFEIHLRGRTYNFMAPDAKQAHEWVDKLQSCIQ